MDMEEEQGAWGSFRLSARLGLKETQADSACICALCWREHAVLSLQTEDVHCDVCCRAHLADASTGRFTGSRVASN